MFKATLDTRQFDKTLKEYMQFTKRSVAEVANAKCWFIARNATNTTKAVDRSKIDAELDAPSRINPEAPLAAILVNKQLRGKGMKGVSGSQMQAAIKKLKAARKRSINFLRSGWLPAVRILEYHLKKGDIQFSKRYAPKLNRQTKQFGREKGAAIYARPERERTFAEIENAVYGGKKPSPRVHDLIVEGLQKAITQEVASMKTYIERKLNPEINKFNR